MFPKYLKVAASQGYINREMINATHFTEKVMLYYYDQKMLDTFAGALGFSYQILLSQDEEIGFRLPNGLWTGALGMLQRREVDMVVSTLFIDEGTHEEFRMTYPHTAYESTFITEKPEPEPVMAYFLYPFSIPVWLAIIACIFLMSFTFRRLLRRKNSLLWIFTSILGSLVGQGIDIIPRRRRDYFVLASWIIGSAFLYYFYAAVLLSFLMFPPLHGIRTIDDLAEGIKSGTHECSTVPDTYPFTRNMFLSTNPTVKLIANSINRFRPYYDHPVDYMETYVGDKKLVFLADRQDLVSYTDVYFISEDNFFIVTAAYATNKEFCCGSELDKVIHRGWASGIFLKYASDINHVFFTFKRKKYEKLFETLPAVDKLKLTQLKGPFLFLIVSLSLAFLVFLVEFFAKKEPVLVSKSKINNRHQPKGNKRKKRRIKNSLSIANFLDP